MSTAYQHLANAHHREAAWHDLHGAPEAAAWHRGEAARLERQRARLAHAEATRARWIATGEAAAAGAERQRGRLVGVLTVLATVALW